MKSMLTVILLFAFSSCRNITYETILIPEGYTGDVIIIFNQKGKEKRKFEGKHKVYEIPKDGILLTEFKDEGKQGSLQKREAYNITLNYSTHTITLPSEGKQRKF